MSKTGRTAFVFGATGYTGREVVRQLREQDVRTIAHIRPGSRSTRWRASFQEWSAEVVELPFELDTIRRAIEGARPDVVFGLLGTTRARAKREGLRSDDIYDAVDYRLTALLVDAVAAVQPHTRFVYLSSIGADTTSRDRYLAARGRTEERLVSSGLAFTIARPSFITGPGRDRFRLGERAGAFAADRLLGAARLFGAKELQDRYRSIDNAALAHALVAMAFDPSFIGKTVPAAEIQRLAR